MNYCYQNVCFSCTFCAQTGHTNVSVAVSVSLWLGEKSDSIILLPHCPRNKGYFPSKQHSVYNSTTKTAIEVQRKEQAKERIERIYEFPGEDFYVQGFPGSHASQCLISRPRELFRISLLTLHTNWKKAPSSSFFSFSWIPIDYMPALRRGLLRSFAPVSPMDLSSTLQQDLQALPWKGLCSVLENQGRSLGQVSLKGFCREKLNNTG